ncbi:LamG-like jellyroll fold domain-containing protein [Salegentibacter salarius]|uniref:LamG-like jellyroll fold domain-containing protein n=1 Tax=Salegentibacter salarius TaxID=435906 RepID=UPI001C4076B5|nr:LamG-like jellyroll fold domain-containing protein [Salegentibacter salarius]
MTNDNCSIAEVSNDAPATFPLGTTVVTWTVIDEANNTVTSTQEITVQDTQSPEIPSLPDLTSECPLTVTPPTTEDNCDGTITATTGITDFTFDESGSVFWTFTDAAGNQTGPIEQKVIINNTVAPVPDANSLPTFTINGCQISSISELNIPTATDTCEGTISGTLNENFEFPYSFIGTNTIEWEFIDSKGNIATQTQEIRLEPFEVDGGALNGTFESEVFNEQIDISACGKAISIELDLIGENGNIVHWEKYSVNKGVWEVINNTNDSYTVNFAEGELISTFYRVLVQTGTCSDYSNSFYIRTLPVGDAPTVENLKPETNNKYCLGDEVNLLARSNYTDTQPALPDEAPGDFRNGQLNANDPDSWLVDGEVGGFSSGGNSSQTRNWSGTNANGNKKHTFGDIQYDSQQGVFAVAQGDYTKNNYKGEDPSTLESPILDFSNALAASLDFDQAFYFANNDFALIEISTNGGNTYSTLRVMHSPGSGVKKWFTAGTAESYAGSNATNYNFSTDNTSIPLDEYIGENNVRIRWTFRGTSDKSIWALDNIFISKEVPVDTELEWTDGIGDPNEDPIVVGETEVPISFTPNVPGQHEYGGTALINGCRTYSEEGTDLINILVSYSYAGENISFSGDECGQNTVQLNAYDNTLTANENNAKGAYPGKPTNCKNCDDPGTGEIGTWSWTRESGSISCVPESFSDVNDPNATFTGNEGTYTLTWTVDGCSDFINVEIKECNQINFDGVNDYIDFGEDKYNLSNSTNKKAFSLEVWIKPESTNGNQTIFSKRDENNANNKGYDLSMDDGEVSFNWNNNGSINSSPHKVQTNRWYHIAITHSVSGEYKLYVDGVLIKTTSGGSPGANTSRALLGAVDQSQYNAPTNHFTGWMEEFRIWDIDLSAGQLREMMNQRIKENGTAVTGEVLNLNVANLNWGDLIGYYRMDNVGCGKILPYDVGGDVGFPGKLRNITSPQQTSAPLPYESEAAGNWHTRNSWDPNSTKYWTFPNDEGINGDPINWNIARQKHNLNSNNKDIKLLALFSETGTELIMEGVNNNSGNELRITRYLDLSGYIDLNGESQLVQTEGSILEGNGGLERDQQGTSSSFNYNYWSSPVLPDANSTTYKVNEILHDGSTVGTKAFKNINFQWSHTHADGSKSNPIKVSDYWINAFRARKANEYSQWEQIGSYTALKPGEGYTMKGTENVDIATGKIQNYTFKGFPGNGDINVSQIQPDQNYLLGNPYPSAINVEEFILDNIKDSGGRNDKNLLNGAVYFWDHFSGKTHYLAKYVGGYATRNLLDGVPAISNDSRINATGAQGNKRPGAFIPVAQGFFVNTTQDAQAGSIDNFDTGKIIFKNSQRYFRSEETESISVFMEEKNTTQKAKTNQSKKTDTRFKIRLKFNSPTGYHREISVGADARTSQGFDLGFDARLLDRSPEDMYWMIDDGRFVIQGVPHFNLDQRLPLGITIAEEKEFSIEIGELENVPDIIDIYLRDNSDSTYYDLRKEAFKASLPAGEYQDLYEIVFHDVTSTRKDKEPGEGPIDYYYSLDNREFVISNPELHKIEHINIYNIAGQLVDQHFGIPDVKEIRVPQKKNLSSAVYIVKVYTDSGDYAKKVIIRKD